MTYPIPAEGRNPTAGQAQVQNGDLGVYLWDNRTYNIRDYGAKGDGVTDDTLAIQTAINVAILAEGTVLIPTGVYRMTSPAIFGNIAAHNSKSLRILGLGFGSVLKAASTSVAALLKPTGQNTDVDPRYDGRVYIAHLQLLGAGGTGGGYGIHSHGVQGITVHHVKATGNFSEAFRFENTDIIEVSRCYIYGNKTGIHTVSSGTTFTAAGGNANTCVVFDNLIYNNTVKGFQHDGGHGLEVMCNNFVNNLVGIDVANTSAYTAITTLALIQGNYFESHSTAVLRLGGGSGIVRRGLVLGNVVLAPSGSTVWKVQNVEHATVIWGNDLSAQGGAFTRYDDAGSTSKPLYDGESGRGFSVGNDATDLVHVFRRGENGQRWGIHLDNNKFNIRDVTNARDKLMLGAATGLSTLNDALEIGGPTLNIANAAPEYRTNGTKVVGLRKTGWQTASGTATRSTFATSTVTLPQLAQRVKALIDDLHSSTGHGLIG